GRSDRELWARAAIAAHPPAPPSLRPRRRAEHALASRTATHRPLQSRRMRKGVPRAHSFALMAILVLLAACSSPAATPGASAPKTSSAAPTIEPTLAPDAPCRDCW